MIGITSRGGYYSSFADHYLNYVSVLRWLLLHSSRLLLELVGYRIYFKDIYTLKLRDGLGVHVGYDCIGYGVMIFWLAFIFANRGSFIKKLKWITGGLFVIWIVNVLRISLMLVSVNGRWPTVFNLDNHSWFNIAAYSVIFVMIYLFDRAERKEAASSETVNHHFNNIE